MKYNSAHIVTLSDLGTHTHKTKTKTKKILPITRMIKKSN